MTNHPPFCPNCRRYLTAAEVIESWHKRDKPPLKPAPQAERGVPRPDIERAA